jgi:predicted nucleic acid-binding protein
VTVVIDASVALKWVLDEEGSDRARALAASETMIAPDLWLIECANVLTMRVRRGKIAADAAVQAVDLIASAPVRIVPTRGYVPTAHALSVALNQSAYDSLYLALALGERAVMVTADATFFRAASAASAYASSVRLL